jgi:hypothetical protein
MITKKNDGRPEVRSANGGVGRSGERSATPAALQVVVRRARELAALLAALPGNSCTGLPAKSRRKLAKKHFSRRCER